MNHWHLDFIESESIPFFPLIVKGLGFNDNCGIAGGRDVQLTIGCLLKAVFVTFQARPHDLLLSVYGMRSSPTERKKKKIVRLSTDEEFVTPQ